MKGRAVNICIDVLPSHAILKAVQDIVSARSLYYKILVDDVTRGSGSGCNVIVNPNETDPFSRWTRTKLWASRYLRYRDLLQLALAVVTYVLLLAMYRPHPNLAAATAIPYTLLILLVAVDIIRGRRKRDYAHSAVLREFFEQLGRDVFGDGKGYRVTIFKQSPSNRDYIVPWYRYRKGDVDVIESALNSRAKYRLGEGFTGDAWLQKGQELICASFPEFGGSREAFEAYYSEQLLIDPETVSELSDTMINVRTILSYGFEGRNGEFLGVLSIDLGDPITVDENTNAPQIGSSYLYADTLIQTLRSMNLVLQGFSNAELRKL